MATVFSEDWSAGNSIFSSVYRYNRVAVGDPDSEADDPLYPYIWVAEGVYVNEDGRLDLNPAFEDPEEFRTYGTAGVWFKGFGPDTTTLGGGYFNASVGCMQTVYHPTEASLNLPTGDGAYYGAPLLGLFDAWGFPLLGCHVSLDDMALYVWQRNVSTHEDNVLVTGAPMPVVGEPYTVRMGWQCGTFDPVDETVEPDGFVRIWINGELIYEAINIDLILEYPYTYLVDQPNMVDSCHVGYYGLLGPLESVTLSDSACVVATNPVFKSGKTSSPVVWMKLLLKEA